MRDHMSTRGFSGWPDASALENKGANERGGTLTEARDNPMYDQSLGQGGNGQSASGQFFAAQQSVLLIGDASVTLGWSELVSDARARLLDCVPTDEAVSRLAHIVDVDVIVADCRNIDRTSDPLVMQLDQMAARADVAVLLVGGGASIDHIFSLVANPQPVILCDPSQRDIVMALAAALLTRRRPDALHDPIGDEEPGELARLGRELERLSQLIEGLMHERGNGRRSDRPDGAGAFHAPHQAYGAEPSEYSGPAEAYRIRSLIRIRRMRDHIMPDGLFADPAWDILLDLMAARLEGTRVSVSSLCIAAAVPPTTALRWIRQLTDQGLLERQADARDARRVFIALSNEGARLIEQWLAAAQPWLEIASRTD